MFTDIELKLTQLQKAVEAGGENFSPGISERAREELKLAYSRMTTGTGFVVTALVGGTGSGKSTLFNRLTGLTFAATSEVRPTTIELMACTWGMESRELLDVLQIPRSNRFPHGSLLTAGHEDRDDLVLIDSPDYDSVNSLNSAHAAHLVPMVDVLIWVLDPQKYADMSQYYRLVTFRRGNVTSHGGTPTMIVVLNKIDTVAAAERLGMLEHVRETLDSIGLAGVPVIATSAVQGDGIDDLDRTLLEASLDRELWRSTAGHQLEAVAELLRSQLGHDEPALAGEPLDKVSRMVVDASGVHTVAEAVRDGASHHVEPKAPAPTLCVATRDMWVAHCIDGLPLLWQADVEQSIPSADSLRKRIDGALNTVPIPIVKRTPSWPVWVAALVVGILACASIVMGLFVDRGVVATMPISVTGLYGAGIALIVIAAVILLVGLTRMRRVRAHIREAAGDMYEREAVDAVRAALESVLVPGPDAVLKRHRAARTLLSV